MITDHTDTFTTNSGAPRKALYLDVLHPSPMRLACNVKYVGRPRLRPHCRPSHPSPSASGRVPLLETPFQPRVDCLPSQHFREGGGGRSQQYRNGPAVSTTRGPFPSPPLLQQRPADTESSIPQRRPGDAPASPLQQRSSPTPKLQALVYDILPSTTAVFSYATGSRKLSANDNSNMVVVKCCLMSSDVS